MSPAEKWQGPCVGMMDARPLLSAGGLAFNIQKGLDMDPAPYDIVIAAEKAYVFAMKLGTAAHKAGGAGRKHCAGNNP